MLISIEDFVGQIEIRDNRVPIYFSLKKLHKLQFPFKKAIDNRLLQKLELPEGLAVETTEEGIYEVQGILEIHHAPTNTNFWHLEFKLFDMTRDSDIKEIKSKIIKSFKQEKELDEQHPTTKLGRPDDILPCFNPPWTRRGMRSVGSH